MRCRHKSQHGLWWFEGRWVLWTAALRFGMRWEQMAAHRCNECGAWVAIGESRDTPATDIEVRAAEIAADKRTKMGMCEAFGWESLLSPKFSTDPVDAGYSAKWHAGYLARCIVEHTEEA